MVEFKIGDKVEILNITNFKTDCNSNIPRSLMIHGTYYLHETNPEAYIVAIYNEYYIVNYRNSLDQEMQLGFLAEDLELLEKVNTELSYSIW